jgi:hypothetical protein
MRAVDAIREYNPSGFWDGRSIPLNVSEVGEQLADAAGGVLTLSSSKRGNPYLILAVGGKPLNLSALEGKEVELTWQILLPLKGRLTIEI